MIKITRKQFVFALIAAAVLSGVGLLTNHYFAIKDKISYITASSIRMDLEECVLASGILKPFKTVEVGAQVSGQLKTLHAALGDKVKKGQMLAVIDPVLQQNTLKDAEAQVENLKAQKRSKQAMLKEYEAAYRRQSQMVAKDASSQADLDSARALLESTRADISALDAQIKKAIIAVDTAKANLGYTKITAPMDGVIISINIEEGQTVVSTQTATTILTLADLDIITVKAKISEADVIRVNPGLKVFFTLIGDAETRYYSKLRAIEPGAASTSTTSSSSAGSSTSSSSSTTGSAIYYYGLFEIPNPDNKLRTSMTAQVSIVLNEVKNVLCIPIAALGEKEKDGSYKVKILRNNIPETRFIRAGVNNKVYVQVMDGIQEGEKVVVGDSTSVVATQEQNTRSMPPGPPPGRR
jgi:membrane fusion protein, macrolide-specific efflux system